MKMADAELWDGVEHGDRRAEPQGAYVGEL
jgi:hypothetical protein